MDFSLNRSFVLILVVQYIAYYRVSKVIKKHKKLNHNHPKNIRSSIIIILNHNYHNK